MSDEDTQGEFKLEDQKVIPIECTSMTIGWMILHEPKILVGCHIDVVKFGLTAKFTIIPPTWLAGENIMNTMREDRNAKDRNFRRSNTRNAPTRYTL